ncbi:unnamed protein product [Notodromas monacha]|uniref:Uncharacterized protein n=1 Tax=Notodromas monacha TaxID=399045 RepID=A0A7R9BMI1_9CRUS|nr:unnamed protein product [Notodromas monacha]CAG0918237.1 unnamed protein product [Notodromas monacha]
MLKLDLTCVKAAYLILLATLLEVCLTIALPPSPVVKVENVKSQLNISKDEFYPTSDNNEEDVESFYIDDDGARTLRQIDVNSEIDEAFEEGIEAEKDDLSQPPVRPIGPRDILDAVLKSVFGGEESGFDSLTRFFTSLAHNFGMDVTLTDDKGNKMLNAPMATGVGR